MLHDLFRLRNRHFFLIDAAIVCLTPTVALLLAADSLSMVAHLAPALVRYTLLAAAVRLSVFYLCGLYRRLWCYASVIDMLHVVSGVLLSSLLITLLFAGLQVFVPLEPSLPHTLPLLDCLLVLIAVGGNRISLRAVELCQYRCWGKRVTRVLIIGTGETGAMLAREMLRSSASQHTPVGFIDDDVANRHMRIHGIPVLGGCADIPDLVRRYAIQEVVIARSAVSGKLLRNIVAICEQAEITAKIVPGIGDLLDGKVTISQMRNVELQDLLRREPIQTDTAAVEQLLRGKRVLVTGGGGSIGSELCRQILRCHPSHLTILGHGENSVFEIQQELQRVARTMGTDLPQVEALIADIRFRSRLVQLIQERRPHIIFHAAAHKHVPLMEQNPTEAVDNNVLGTLNVLTAAQAADVERFVMISTDKAVNPTSIMGATKRVAELLIHQAAQRTGRPYVAVRFGNVLGSRGSVVLTFKKQIAAGGPVTVTHPEMVRYFMTIPEAVQLVLQAAVLGRGGEVFMLDMGQPMKIVDLARDLVTLSGFKVGRDIDIVFTGTRPGEKLYEEMFTESEAYHRTTHEKLLIAANASHFVPSNLTDTVRSLIEASRRGDYTTLFQLLQVLVPEYQGGLSVEEADITHRYQPFSRALTTNLTPVDEPQDSDMYPTPFQQA